ncbi:MAG: DNA repair protein RecN [Prevotellaceae bacterium]|nr:DNA repair protein RecN [Prevotellaceae bacterium]
MLVDLNIENYALIDKLNIRFDAGLSIITGETGAGKSILLGALSLVLGERADTNVLKNKDKNCVVEGMFRIDGYGLTAILASNDIDVPREGELIVRRVINPAGKSRAFINDSPVSVSTMKEIGDKLIDVHSQHQNLLLATGGFRLSVVDALAVQGSIRDEYGAAYGDYRDKERKLASLRELSAQAKNDYEYIKYRYEQLEQAKLLAGEQEDLEAEASRLRHAEEIREGYGRITATLSGDEISVSDMLKEIEHIFGKLAAVHPESKELAERTHSILIEVKDVAEESERIGGQLQSDPSRLAEVEQRLNLIYDLQQRHRVDTVAELIAIRDKLDAEIIAADNFDEELAALQKAVDEAFDKVKKLGAKLSEGRSGAIPEIERYITSMLKQLGIPNVVFKVRLTSDGDYTATGRDEIGFMFSANKDVAPREISKVASGGEMSRLMLSLKSLLAESVKLPTIIFDEIDTGVSGEVSDKMGDIIKRLSKGVQVINITHLPQVAAKGDSHYLVYKEDTATATLTKVRRLNRDERVDEIAKMLSGSVITDAAIAHAKTLIFGLLDR